MSTQDELIAQHLEETPAKGELKVALMRQLSTFEASISLRLETMRSTGNV